MSTSYRVTSMEKAPMLTTPIQEQEDGSTLTKRNWATLQRMAALFLSKFRKEHPDWNYTDLRQALDLPDTPVMRTLTSNAGFALEDHLSLEQEHSVLLLMVGGVLEPEKIADRTGLPAKKVQEFIISVLPGFGQGRFGGDLYPAFPMSETIMSPDAVIRKISEKGQFSYQGKRYGVGVDKANQICLIRENNGMLQSRFERGEEMRLKR